LHDVENDADAVFVVVTDDALISIGCITHDYAIFSDRAFRGLPARQVDAYGVRRWTVAEKESFDVEGLWLKHMLRCGVTIALVGMRLNMVR
jgi:hypothetical protein